MEQWDRGGSGDELLRKGLDRGFIGEEEGGGDGKNNAWIDFSVFLRLDRSLLTHEMRIYQVRKKEGCEGEK